MSAEDDIEEMDVDFSGGGRAKRPREDDDYEQNAGAKRPGGYSMPSADIMRRVDEAEPEDALDLTALRRMVASFEKKVSKNQELRAKFGDDPEKFMDSEIDLDMDLKGLHVLAPQPELYPEFVRLGAVPTLLGLLSHENTDICTSTISLLQELVDSDNMTQRGQACLVLIDALLEGNCLEMLVQNIDRLEEEAQQEDAQAIHNTMSIIEDLIEWKPTIRSLVTERTQFLSFLMGYLKKPMSPNKLYATEMLAILLQGSADNQRRLHEASGIDPILMGIAQYKKKDPVGADEEEMLENMYDALCAALMHPPNQELFRVADGIQLMLIVMKNKNYARAAALKALDFALLRNGASCEKFVEDQGLGTVFGAFMKRPKKAKSDEDGDEEHSISVIASLFLYTTGARRERLVAKFVENDNEKMDRLVEMHVKWLGRLRECDREIEEDKRIVMEDGDDPSLLEDEFYVRRLDAGLFTLQLVDYVLASVCTTQLDNTLRGRIEKQLHTKNLNLDTVKGILLEYAMTYGDGSDDEANVAQMRDSIQQLVSRL